MATKAELKDWVVEAIEAQGGEAHLVDVAEHIWRNYEDELRASGDLFYTWQYDMRWAAQRLRNKGVLAPDDTTPQGVWRIA